MSDTSARGVRFRPDLRRTFSSLASYNFRLYWSGQLVSMMGTWMQRIGQAWLVLQLTHSSVALGVVSALQTLPVLVMSLFTGVIVDRVPRHRLLLFTQSLSLVQALLLAILTGTGHITIWEIDLLALMLGAINATDNPARQSFVMELVGRENVVNAVGLNSAQLNCSRLIGPALGGVLISGFGVAVCFYVNAASFLATLVALLLMRPSQFYEATVARKSGRMLAEVGRGVGFLASSPDLLVVIIMLAGIGTFGYNWNTVTPLLAETALHIGATGFGVLISALGVGSLVGAMTFASRGRSSERILLISGLVFGLAYMAVAFSFNLGSAFALYVVLGFAGLTFTSTANTTLQLRSPAELRGRVMGIYSLLMQGSTPIGALFTGLVAAAVGIRFTVGAEAGFCLLGFALAVLYRGRMALRLRVPLPPAERPPSAASPEPPVPVSDRV